MTTRRVRLLTFMVVLLAAAAFGLLLVAAVQAQSGGTNYSSIQVQNLSTTDTATFIIEFFEEDTGARIDAATINDTIPPGGSNVYFLSQNQGLPAGFRGAAVVSSDQPIAVISNHTYYSSSGDAYSSYEGIGSPATSVYVPALISDYNGWTSWVVVQNAGLSSTDVQIDYYRDGTASAVYSQTQAIPANAMHVFSLADIAATLGARFKGSAIVTSLGGEPLAVTVEWQQGSRLRSYTGVPSGLLGTEYLAPVMRRNYSAGWNTALRIVNAGTNPATVYMTYRGGGLADPVVVSDTVSTSKEYQQAGVAGLPNNWNGSATITSTEPIAVSVNMWLSYKYPSASYNGIVASQAATEVKVPLAQKWYSAGWNTSFTFQNPSASTAVSLTITYDGGGLGAPVVSGPHMLDPASSLFLLQSQEAGLPSNWRGGATVVADNPVVMIVNNNLSSPPTATDALLIYGPQ